MKSKEYRQRQLLRQTTKVLYRKHFDIYCRMMARLLDSQRSHEFLKPLSDALRQKKWPEFYKIADSLSTQKYDDATSHFVANQFTLLIKKFPWDPKLVCLDPEKTAIESFFKAERRCGRINQKFSILMKDPSRDLFRQEGKAAMQWIRSVIGSAPSYRSVFRECEFGQGASVGVHGDATHIIRKLSDEQAWTVTPGAIHHGFGGLLNNFHFLETLLESKEYSDGCKIVCLDYESAFNKYISRLSIVNSNKLGFVAKTAKTHRSIATEPLLNGYVQKGIDQVLKRKLLRIGLDLSDQNLNQKMAREGSLDDSQDGYVTIDLRGASNSNAINPVKYLYPPDWFRLLDRCRSHYLSYNGEEIRYNMLCSMGNGFCFPIETLTFAAICVACDCGQPGVDFTVYGDDIIVRKRNAQKVLAMLKHYGFSTNDEKTFLEGPFRESCGSDWFVGEDVRPFTLDFAFNRVECFFKYFNLTQSSKRVADFFAPVRTLMLESLPINFRFFRPLKGEVDTGIDSLGDEHLTSPSCTFCKDSARWSWLELVQTPISDASRLDRWRHESWLMGVALRGTKSIPFGVRAGLPDVVFRRKTRAKVTRKSYASTSNWLPPHPFDQGGLSLEIVRSTS
jgi:hypothetical protein